MSVSLPIITGKRNTQQHMERDAANSRDEYITFLEAQINALNLKVDLLVDRHESLARTVTQEPLALRKSVGDVDEPQFQREMRIQLDTVNDKIMKMEFGEQVLKSMSAKLFDVAHEVDINMKMMSQVMEKLTYVTEVVDQTSELKSVLSAEISARRKHQVKCQSAIERVHSRQEEESFSLRKEILFISDTLGGRIHHLETLMSGLTRQMDDTKDYTRAAVASLRDEIRGFSEDYRHHVESSKMAEAKNELRDASHASQVEAKLEDKLNFWYDFIMKKMKERDNRVKVTLEQALREIGDEIENNRTATDQKFAELMVLSQSAAANHIESKVVDDSSAIVMPEPRDDGLANAVQAQVVDIPIQAARVSVTSGLSTPVDCPDSSLVPGALIQGSSFIAASDSLVFADDSSGHLTRDSSASDMRGEPDCDMNEPEARISDDGVPDARDLNVGEILIHSTKEIIESHRTDYDQSISDGDSNKGESDPTLPATSPVSEDAHSPASITQADETGIPSSCVLDMGTADKSVLSESKPAEDDLPSFAAAGAPSRDGRASDAVMPGEINSFDNHSTNEISFDTGRGSGGQLEATDPPTELPAGNTLPSHFNRTMLDIVDGSSSSGTGRPDNDCLSEQYSDDGSAGGIPDEEDDPSDHPVPGEAEGAEGAEGAQESEGETLVNEKLSPGDTLGSDDIVSGHGVQGINHDTGELGHNHTMGHAASVSSLVSDHYSEEGFD
jgi:hypothetical protein